LEDIFTDAFPYYLSIGMTYDQYWECNPYLVEDYRKAHKLQIEQRNQELWLQGLYIYDAFGVVLANAFSSKGSKKQSYIEKPIELFKKKEIDDEAVASAEKEKLIAKLNLWKANWDLAHGEKHGNNS